MELNISHPRLCRDCFEVFTHDSRCRNCNSPRIVSHANLLTLEIAHIDCDAFYASIEKRENPDIRNLPVIVGGQNRGVVTTCCYIARINGVRSAMPIFQAKKLCPNAVIIAPRMDYYRKTSNLMKKMLRSLTPAIEFVSIDEAYINLKGTSRLHGEPPAVQLAKLSKEIETELGITISIGLSHNKFLSKLGSELEKPRGFSIIGHADTKEILKNKSISKILGVGKKAKLTLEANGINLISDILPYDKSHLKALLGSFGETLWLLARGIDNRRISPNKPAKSISCEQTLQNSEINFHILKTFLWDLVEKISSRLKNSLLVAKKLSLKLKSTDFMLIVRSTNLEFASNSPEILFQAGQSLLQKNIKKGPFRLIGITLSNISKTESDGWNKNFFEEPTRQILAAEEAIDDIRSKFGDGSIIKGRSLKNLK